MKYFVFVVFLFSAIVLNSQVTVEEVAYIPSASGYYNNLIVKDNVKINKLKTDTFNVQSYGSILDINVAADSRLLINTLKVMHQNASAALLSNQDESSYNASVTTPSNPPNNRSTPEPPPSPQTNSLTYHTVNMSGGSLSLTKTINADTSSQIQVQNLNFMSASKSPTLNIKVRDMYSIYANNSLQVNDLYIFGMQVPKCPNNYYWQKVKVGSAEYIALACNTVTQ